MLHCLQNKQNTINFQSNSTGTQRLKMKRVSILTLFALAFILCIPVNDTQSTNHGFQEFQKTCSYSIEIETTCAPSADTQDRVSIRFSDSIGNLVIVKHLKNPKLLYAPKNGLKKRGRAYGGFGKCVIDMFEANEPCMTGKVCSLYLKKLGSDNWRPGWVKVYQKSGGSTRLVQASYVFYFRRFLPENVWYGFYYCHSHKRS